MLMIPADNLQVLLDKKWLLEIASAWQVLQLTTCNINLISYMYYGCPDIVI